MDPPVVRMNGIGKMKGLEGGIYKQIRWQLIKNITTTNWKKNKDDKQIWRNVSLCNYGFFNFLNSLGNEKKAKRQCIKFWITKTSKNNKKDNEGEFYEIWTNKIIWPSAFLSPSAMFEKQPDQAHMKYGTLDISLEQFSIKPIPTSINWFHLRSWNHFQQFPSRCKSEINMNLLANVIKVIVKINNPFPFLSWYIVQQYHVCWWFLHY